MDKSPDWNSSWADIDFDQLPPLGNGLFSNFLDIVVPGVAPNSKSAIEIGCFPGKFIEYIGQKGYSINGIDTYSRVGDIAGWATRRGRFVGSFEQESLEDFARSSQRQFDVVLSLGFIEHFANFCEVLYDHASLCAVGGLVIIGAPNFSSPIQRALHQVLDGKNLSAHVLEAMYPKVWAVYLGFLGFRIDYAGSIGGFDFWNETAAENPKITVLQKLIPHLSPFAQKLSEEFNARESSYMALVGTKTRELPDKNETIAMAKLCQELALDFSNKDGLLAESGAHFLSGLCK